jgi:hypothetical protein
MNQCGMMIDSHLQWYLQIVSRYEHSLSNFQRTFVTTWEGDAMKGLYDLDVYRVS